MVVVGGRVVVEVVVGGRVVVEVVVGGRVVVVVGGCGCCWRMGCGCNLSAKTLDPNSECPLAKWKKKQLD